MRKITILIIVIFSSVYLSAQTKGLVATAEHNSNQTVFLSRRFGNPAFMHKAYNNAYSQLGILFNYSSLNKAIVLQEGSGISKGSIAAYSYKPLSDSKTVWGTASYSSSVKKNVKWNSSSDYFLLYPYVLADSVGGNLKNEQYLFSGGYSIRLGKFVIGGELGYRAEHEYRSFDPRPSNVVSDLKLKIGSYINIPSYKMGVSLTRRVYKQTNSVEFYKEAGVIGEFQMTGLGSYYQRFSGDITSLHHKGAGWVASFDIAPAGDSGYYGTAVFKYDTYDRIAILLNSIPLTALNISSYQLESGWKQNNRNDIDWGIAIICDYSRRRGIENLAGSASSSSYPIIARLLMYKNEITSIEFKGFCGKDYFGVTTANKQVDRYGKFVHRTINWNIVPSIGYISFYSRYMYPQKEMSFSKIFVGSDAQMFFTAGENKLLDFKLAARYYSNLNSKIVLPYADMQKSIVNAINYSYEQYKTDYTVVSARLRLDYKNVDWKIGCFLCGYGSYIISRNGNKGYNISINTGITF